MLYDFLSKRDKSQRINAVSSWNWHRGYVKQMHALREAGALKGEVLEIGPGEGILAGLSRAADIRYRGLERNPTFQSLLEARGFDVVLGSAPPLPFEDKEFDLVCAMHVLEHMVNFEVALELVQECHRVLKPDGMLALAVPDYLRAGIEFFQWDYTHSFPTTVWRVQQILGDAGFEIERIVHFTGSLTSPFARWPVDLIGFILHTRLVYWLGSCLGLDPWFFKFHKTFEPSFLVISRKIDKTQFI